MPVSTLQYIPSHPRANAYIGLTEANQYFTDRDNSDSWTAASESQKTQAIIEATRLIDSFRFQHTKLKYWQRLEFPRIKADVYSGSVDSATSNTITDSDIAGVIQMADDFWKYAGLWFFDDGDANYMKFYFVTGFNATTGTITIDGNFDETVAVGDNYQLIFEVPAEIKWAVCETALSIIDDLLEGGNTQNIKRQKLGDEEVEYFDQSVQTVNLPPKAIELIQPYIRNTGSYVHTPMFR